MAPAQIVYFDWSGAKQDSNDRKVQPGELTELVNVRYPLDGGSPEKRFGHDKTTVAAFSGGTYQGPATEMLPAPTEIWRDSANQIWGKDGSTGYYRGLDLRAHPTWTALQNIASVSAAAPACAYAGGNLFYFYRDGSTGYVVVVLDPVTGVVKLEATKIAVGDIAAFAATADANGVVWLFYVTGGIDVVSHQFNGPTGTPVERAFYTHSGENFVAVDARLLTATGEVAVVAVSNPGGSTDISHLHAYLDTATGNAKVSPAPVFTTLAGSGVGAPICAGGLSLLNEDGSAGVVRYSFWRTKSVTDAQLVRVKASGATLAILDTVELYAATFGDTTVAAMSGGYLDTASGHEVYEATAVDVFAGGSADPKHSTRALVRRHIYDGATVTTDIVARSAILAGRPFEVGGTWYFVTSFDDGPVTRAQRGYFVRRADGLIVTTVLDGEGAAWDVLGVTTPVVLDATTVLLPALQEGFTGGTPAPTLVSLDFAADYQSDAPNIITSGVPKYVSPQDVVRELALIHYPYEAPDVVDGDGTSTSVVYWTWRYATIDSSDRITRSAPYPTVGPTTLHDVGAGTLPQLVLPTLRHTIGPTWIELYGTVPGGTDIFLQRQLPNDPTVDTITVTVQPSAEWTDSGELLDTTGGALANTSVPPARLATIWRDHLWLAGTAEGDIWPSKELVPGRGWEFSPELAFEWHDGTGEITAIAPLGFDALVVFRQDAIGLVQGTGPDNNAQGTGWQVATITTKKGVTNPHAVTIGKDGVYFQNAADDRVCVVSGGTVTEVNQGMESYRDYVPTAAVHIEGERATRWYCSNGKQLVLDHAHSLPDQPAGTWIRYESSALPAAVGARLINGVPTMLEAGTSGAAAFWTPNTNHADNGVVCLTDWTTGRLAPAGPLNEFDTDMMALSSTLKDGDSTYEYTLTDDQGNTEVHDDVASSVADVAFRTALFRTREFKLRVRETSATGGGRVFDGVAVEVRPYGRMKNQQRRIA